MAGVKKNSEGGEFDREAFKKAIAHVESSGGKNLSNPNSSAAGKYHFLYRYIKDNPLLKGVSKREFMNRPDLQEKIMDMAIDGKLPGFPSYRDYAIKLKTQYGSNMDTHQIAALTHFLGMGGVKKYLSNPNGFKVPGKNASVDQYIQRFNSAFAPMKVRNAGSPEEQQAAAQKYLVDNINERGQGQVKVDATSVKQPKVIKTEKFDFQDSGVELIEALNQESVNQMAMGGNIKSHGVEDVIPIENGGTHEQNPHGGVPMGYGANGKMNTVEEGEVKFGDYIFSNRFGLGGPLTTDGNPNTFENGGDTDPKKKKESKKNANPVTEPVFGPIAEDKPLEFTKSEPQYTPGGGLKIVSETFEVPDVREQYMYNDFVTTVPGDKVYFDMAVQDESAQEFLNRYNDPWTRETMKKQTGLSDEDIDNMILKGLNVRKQVGGNVPGSKASFDANENVLKMGEEHLDEAGVETHERVHGSLFDAAQGENLMKVLGNPFQQETRSFLKKYSPDTLRYLRKPHEAYGNFTEFREKLGLKPGQQIDVETLNKLVKKKGLGSENFIRAFDDDKVVKALNTIADAGQAPSSDEYRLA